MKKVLNYAEVDHGWYESENSVYGISNNDSLYLPKNERKKTWSVISKNTKKEVFEGKTRKLCVKWIESKTNKLIKFV